MKIYDEQIAPELTTNGTDVRPEISVFLPVYNEEPNLRPLHQKLDDALRALGRSAEIVFVDDGSSDGSLHILRELAEIDPRVRVVALRRNYGQTAAMSAGIDAARGKVLIPMDADLQNDPADIIRLLDKLDEGYDVVSGWRKNRKDKMVTRKIPSRIANRLISWIGGVPLHDYGCSLEGLSSRISARRAFVRRDAPVHSDLRFVGGRSRNGNSGRASSAHDGQIEVWSLADDQSCLRSDHDQVHGVVSNEAAIPFWLGRTADFRHLVLLGVCLRV